jgi:oligopeptide transport system substrate-binding protein
MNRTLATVVSAIFLSSLCFLPSCGVVDIKSIKKENLPHEVLAKDQVLRINLSTEPPTLDPRRVTDLTSFIVLKALFEGLTRVGRDNTIEMAAAESVEVSKDLTTYIFKLRDCKWNNGETVTAYDFEYAWKQILSPDFDTSRSDTLYVIKNGERAKKGEVPVDQIGIFVPNEKTLVVALEYPTPYFLELITNPDFYPVHRENDQKNKKWANTPKNYISNGPFRLTRWEHNYELEVVKNENYWDKDHVPLQSIQMLMVNDSGTELNLFEAGDLDWAGQPMSHLPTDILPALKQNGTLHFEPSAATYMYLFNTKQFPFNTKKIRQAMSLAINRQQIVDNITQGEEMPAQRLTPPGILANYAPIFSDGDTDRAKVLFEQALGELQMTRRELPPVVLVFNTNDSHRKIAQAVQEQWRKILGLDVRLENMEWKVYLDKVNSRDYQVARYGWIATVSDPIDFLYGFVSEDHPNNPTGWSNVVYTELIEKSRSEVDEEKRLRLLDQAERILIDEAPVAPVYHFTSTYIKKENLRGMYLTKLGLPEFKYAYKVDHSNSKD